MTPEVGTESRLRSDGVTYISSEKVFKLELLSDKCNKRLDEETMESEGSRNWRNCGISDGEAAAEHFEYMKNIFIYNPNNGYWKVQFKEWVKVCPCRVETNISFTGDCQRAAIVKEVTGLNWDQITSITDALDSSRNKGPERREIKWTGSPFLKQWGLGNSREEQEREEEERTSMNAEDIVFVSPVSGVPKLWSPGNNVWSPSNNFPNLFPEPRSKHIVSILSPDSIQSPGTVEVSRVVIQDRESGVERSLFEPIREEPNPVIDNNRENEGEEESDGAKILEEEWARIEGGAWKEDGWEPGESGNEWSEEERVMEEKAKEGEYEPPGRWAVPISPTLSYREATPENTPENKEWEGPDDQEAGRSEPEDEGGEDLPALQHQIACRILFRSPLEDPQSYIRMRTHSVLMSMTMPKDIMSKVLGFINVNDFKSFNMCLKNVYVNDGTIILQVRDNQCNIEDPRVALTRLPWIPEYGSEDENEDFWDYLPDDHYHE